MAVLVDAVRRAGYDATVARPGLATAAPVAARQADAAGEHRGLVRDLAIAAILSVPLLVLAMSHGAIPGADGPAGRWLQFALATPVVFGPGRRFLALAAAALEGLPVDKAPGDPLHAVTPTPTRPRSRPRRRWSSASSTSIAPSSASSPPASVIAWFYQVLRNAVIDHHRRSVTADRRLERLAAELERDADRDAELAGAVCRCVQSLADTLRPDYAEALRRIEVDGVAVKDFAVELGITANNAAVRVFRAREALRRQVLRACGTCAEHGCLDCCCGAPTG